MECVSSRAIIMALSFLGNETKLGSHAAKLIGDDSISDVENTVLALYHIWHDFWRAVFEIQ